MDFLNYRISILLLLVKKGRSDGKGVGRGAVRMWKNKGGPEVKGIWPIKRFSATVALRRRKRSSRFRVWSF